jgi:radical SAM superfamily enzyme YgiQ (UPF0313 family)
VNNIIAKDADKWLNDEYELLSYIQGNNKIKPAIPDFSIYNLADYFTSKPVIPIRTSYSCPYKGCAFCTHYEGKYTELPVEDILKTIKKSKQKYFFLIDDMITKKRLLELAKNLKPLNIIWACQLKPTSDLNKETLKQLYDSGLKNIMWGIESGSNRLLKLMNKGTTKEVNLKVLDDAHNLRIKNIAYLIFGSPPETKDEFLETIDFLEKAKIDLVSTSVFGLQKGSIVFNNPENYSITEIKEEKRTLLPPKLSYKLSKGISQKQAAKLQSNYQKTINKLNLYPKQMNFFREHMLILC